MLPSNDVSELVCSESLEADLAAEASSSWFSVFFDEQNIVHTMQCLLIDTSKTIEDLSALCVAMHNNPMVLSFTHTGLMPIASAHMYIYPYALMNKQQLGMLRSQILHTKQTFEAVFQQDTYIVHGLRQPKVDSVVVLFAASCLILHGLSTMSSHKRGYASTNLDQKSLAHHTNATLFHIIHACGIRASVAYEANRMLRKHGVSTCPKSS